MKTTLRVYAAVLVALMTLAIAVPSQAALFKIGESREMSMGRDAAEQIERQYPVSRDPKVNDIVNEIGFRLARVSERPNLPWKFRVLDIKDVNAFSVPGYVYVNKGLIDFAKGDQAQIAAVVAHEIGHTTGRHAVHQAEQQMTYGLALGLLLRGNAAQLGNIAANLALLGYSRKDEYDADKRGVTLLSKAGYDPNSMITFFENLNAKERDNPSRFETYFRTHPSLPSRITRVQSQIRTMGLTPVR